MKEYYFLASLLPQLEIGHVPSLGFPELKVLIEENVSSDDLRRVYLFLRLIDIENLRALWAGQRLDPRGNFNEVELRQSLSDQAWPGEEPFSKALQDYLEKFATDTERLEHFAQLMSAFLAEKSEVTQGFLSDYFAFEREWRLVLVGFRAKALGRSIEQELQFEDPTDTLVAQLLAQKDAKGFEPPFEYRELKPLFETYGNSPLELHKAMVEWRFTRLVELWRGQLFTIDRILNYMARLLLVEKWLELDVQKGIEVIDQIEEDIS